jgi:hypothetical protein
MANDSAAYAAAQAARPRQPEPEDVDELQVGGLPAGVWRATLTRVTRRVVADEETGEVKTLLGWSWDVELEDGTVDYRQTTSTANGPRSRFASILAALRPDLAAPGTKVRPSTDLVGRAALLTVEVVEGSTRIVGVSPDRVSPLRKAASS